MPEEYEKWVDAQIISEEASKHIANYKDVISPLTKTRIKNVLETMWKCVNLVSILFLFKVSDNPITPRITNLSRVERISIHFGNLMVPWTAHHNGTRSTSQLWPKTQMRTTKVAPVP